MGSIFYTADDEPLWAHEGYVSALLENGHSTHGTWTLYDTATTVAWRAECSCGWAGPSHPSPVRGAMPNDRQYDAVLGDWEAEHARPLASAQERVFELSHLAYALQLAEAKLKLATERMVPLDDETVSLIDRIVEHGSPGRPLRHPRSGRPVEFLFTHHGRRVTAGTLRDELKRVADAVGIGPVVPHQLRHTFATALVNSGCSLQS